MQALLPLFLGTSLVSEAASPRMSARDWLSLDLYHVSRTVPALSRTLGTPIDPGLQAGYHHAWLGDAVTGGTSLQLAIANYDQLFWSISGGGGLEGVWRTEFGLYLGLGASLDYARLFTGSNNFVWDDGRYRQVTDGGRSFLRATLVELTVGYSPRALRDLGVIPALRYAWMVELPIYANSDANPWSYTVFGPSVLWMWGG